MNLDDLSFIQKLDPENMLAEIDGMPDKLAHAWALAQNMPLPDVQDLTNVVISATGVPGIAAEILAGYAAASCPLPVSLHRDYGLPAFARGSKTLFIACDHSGNTEETLDAFHWASKQGCSILVITTGGTLAEKAGVAEYPLWRHIHHDLASSFAFLLTAFVRLGLLPKQDDFIADAVAAMKKQQGNLFAAVPAATNPAKRYAGQLVGRWVTIFGSGILAAVARCWKSQINRLAKAPANVEILPEADHNALAGIINPSDELLMPHSIALFLRSGFDHPRNVIRANTTRQIFMIEGLNTDFCLSQGETVLAQLWTAIHFGDYMAYYLALAYGINPTHMDTLNSLNAMLIAQN